MKYWKRYIKKVKCRSCGVIFSAYIYNLKRGWGKFCSIPCSKKGNKNRLGKRLTDESKKKISATLKNKYTNGELISPFALMPKRYGEDAPNWRGGLTKINWAIRRLLEYRQWRSDILIKDNYICQICWRRGGKLEADHYPKNLIEIIEKNNIKHMEEAIKCQELWNMNNGRTLCISCHNKTKKGRPMLRNNKEVKRVILETYKINSPCYIRI